MEQSQLSVSHDTVEQENPNKLVIVTGFGPFAGHERVNASWEAVRLLPDKVNSKNECYKIEKQEVAVEYEKVDVAVKNIWNRKPELVIHCGVHGLAECIHVEKQAYNKCFPRQDFAGKYLPNNIACLNNTEEKSKKTVFCSGLDVDKIVDVVMSTCGCGPNDAISVLSDELKNVKSIAKPSEDIGDYLCGYIYLKSLDINCNRTLFIHVPPINRPFSSATTAAVIMQIIRECIRQVEENS